MIARRSVKQNQDCKTTPIDYLIVTRPLFATSTQLLDFAQWKEQQGFVVGLLTVEWIDANYTGAHVAAKIRAAALDTYGGSRVTFLLLVGDTQIDMPSDHVGWYEPTDMYDLTRPWNVPTGATLEQTWMNFTDVFYADADPWPVDALGHPCLQFPAYLDFDIAVGRFPVRLPEELASIVAKSRTFAPAGSVMMIDAMHDAPYAPPPDPCASWPPPFGDPTAEGKCYCHAPYSIQRGLTGSCLTLDYHLLHLDVPTEAAEAQSLALNSTSVTFLVCHGGHDGNFVLPHSLLGSFSSVFPLYVVASCLIDSFYWWNTDSMVETMLKSDKGPAVVADARNEYYFFKGLAEGLTIGQTVYRTEQTFYAGMGPGLFGDPSLVLGMKPTSKPPDWRPHRRWYWLRIVVDIWQRITGSADRSAL